MKQVIDRLMPQIGQIEQWAGEILKKERRSQVQGVNSEKRQ